jgi:hypothetical protein
MKQLNGESLGSIADANMLGGNAIGELITAFIDNQAVDSTVAVEVTALV